MKFLYNTYGFDLLSIFILLICCILNILPYTRIISLLLMLYVLFRAFSKNTYKRYNELNRFTNFVNNKILYRFNKRLPNIPNYSLYNYTIAFKKCGELIKNKFKYKIVRCPNCNQKLRLPRGKKKIIVTCKRSKHEIKKRT